MGPDYSSNGHQIGLNRTDMSKQINFEHLIKDGSIHHSVYSDPDLFELEMDRIFSKTWLMLGHESQIPSPGDFFTTDMARQSVIISRSENGEINGLMNRCTHRGSLLTIESKGNSSTFTCPYHGWTFKTSGELQVVPKPLGYGVEGQTKFSKLGLAKIPKLSLYRGFIFASLSDEVESLDRFLGPMKSSFDDLVDRSPDGNIEIAGGVFKHAYDGNWKLVLENHLDGVHPNYVHISSVMAARNQTADNPNDKSSAKYSDIAVRQMLQNGAPDQVWEDLGMWTTDRGHGYMGDYHSDSRLVVGMNHPDFKSYKDKLISRVGQAEADRILSVTRWNSIIYPNVSFMSQFRQLRIIHPISVNRTVVYTYNVKLMGAPDSMFKDTVAFSNVVNGTASWVLTDDLEVYARVQKGLEMGQPERIDVSRGLGTDVQDGESLLRGGTGTSEIFIRRQFNAWLHYMSHEK
jgi:phenylpropionate dioxygenase-like ring-hydroxylating dioxygenase large terminal subunit